MSIVNLILPIVLIAVMVTQGFQIEFERNTLIFIRTDLTFHRIL